VDVKEKLLPGIKEYLDANDNNLPVTSENLEELIFKVVAGTGMSYDQSEATVRLYFQELRNELIKNKIITIAKLGKFMIKKYHIKFIPFLPFKRFIDVR